MRRGVVAIGVAAVVGLGSCSSGTAREIAADDAARKAAAIGQDVLDQRGVNWTSEDFGRRAAQRDDMTLLDVSGKDAASGVTLTIKVSGVGAEPGWFGSGEDQRFDFCFTMRLSMSGAERPRPADCGHRSPITYPSAAAPPEMPTVESLAKVMAGVTDEAGAKAVLDRLHLDDRIVIDVVVQDERVGIVLKSYGHGKRDCLMIRIGVAKQPEVWRPAAIQLQPGELSCKAIEAAGGAGQKPPH